MADVMALTEQVVLSFVCSLIFLVSRCALASIWLTDVRITILLSTLWSTLLSCGIGRATLTPHVVVGAVVESRIAFVTTKTVEVLPLAETVVVVYSDLVSSNLYLVLVGWPRAQVTE